MPAKARADLWTTADLCRVAGVSDRTVREWRAAGLPTRLVSGQPRFAPEEVWAWREGWHRDRLAEAREAAKDEKRPLLDQKTEIEVALLDLRLARERCEVVPLVDYEVALGRALDLVVARLRGLPVQVSELGPEAELAVEAEVERIITEMHQLDEDVLEEAV